MIKSANSIFMNWSVPSDFNFIFSSKPASIYLDVPVVLGSHFKKVEEGHVRRVN